MLFWRQVMELVRADNYCHPLQTSWPDYFDNTRDVRNGKGRAEHRNPVTVDTIVLHQTAIKFGTRKADRKKYGEREALHRRFYKAPYHCVALMNGDILWNNHARWYTYHGNSSNSTSLGVAIEGSYPGLESKRKASHHPIDQHIIDTAIKAIRLAYMLGKEQGAAITMIQPHRNYSGGRVADPGEGLWREVARRSMIGLGLKVDYRLKSASGRPIPVEWDDRALYDYRGRRLTHT